MNNQTARALCALNNRFYQSNAASFGQTRQAPWQGWEECLEYVRALLGTQEGGSAPAADSAAGANTGGAQSLSVFDLASGNQRFEAFMTQALPEVDLVFYTVDNCAELVASPSLEGRATSSPPPAVTHQHLDILKLICNGLNLQKHLEAPLCDVSVSFGFLHHVPGFEHRKSILESLVQHTRTGGLTIVSFWQFMQDDKLRKKAFATHQRALAELDLPTLDANDYLLGWKDLPKTYRYCHSFTETEIDELINSLESKAEVLARFTADGKTNNLNTYVILRAK